MVALKPLITSTPDSLAPASAHLIDVGQRLAALGRRSSFDRSSHIRARQKLSSPSSISRVSTPSTSVTTAPAASNALRGLHRDVAHFLLQRLADAEVEHQADAQLARRFIEGLPVDLVGRQAHAVAAIGLRQHAHHQGGVIDGAGHRSGDAADIGRIDRNASEARLQRDQAAPARRQPHRAADIGAEMQRAVAGRTRRACAGAGAAGILAEVPGIAGEGMKARQARRQHAVIRHGGLGEDHRAGLAQPRRRRRIRRSRHQLDWWRRRAAPARPWSRCCP